MAGVAAVDPQHTLGAEHIPRQGFEKGLKAIGRKRRSTLERHRLESVGDQMPVGDQRLVAVIGRIALGPEQPGAEDQRQRDLARVVRTIRTPSLSRRMLCSTAAANSTPARSHLFSSTISA